jgi:hypothetical protein
VYIFVSALNHIMETLKIPGQSIHCIYVFVYIFLVVNIVYTIVILYSPLLFLIWKAVTCGRSTVVSV